MILHSLSFWRDAVRWRGSVTPRVLPNVLVFGAIASAIVIASQHLEDRYAVKLGLQVAPFEIAGAALSLILILRTNSGYDRWWEARKLWGGIVNQSRNVVISALAYGPHDSRWRTRFVRLAAAFPHAARCSLRGEPPAPVIAELVGEETARGIAAAVHMPSFVARELAEMLRQACDEHQLDRFSFLQIDRERAQLIDHIGACERILRTPLPDVYAVKIRRFIAIFLLTMPFALLHRLDSEWLIPFITMLAAYPLLAFDQIGVELQNPFARGNLSHLPLDEICGSIERTLQGMSADHTALEAAARK